MKCDSTAYAIHFNMVITLCWASNTAACTCEVKAISTPQGLPKFLPQCRKVPERAENTNPLAQAPLQSGHRTEKGTSRLQKKTTRRKEKLEFGMSQNQKFPFA